MSRALSQFVQSEAGEGNRLVVASAALREDYVRECFGECAGYLSRRETVGSRPLRHCAEGI